MRSIVVDMVKWLSARVGIVLKSSGAGEVLWPGLITSGSIGPDMASSQFWQGTGRLWQSIQSGLHLRIGCQFLQSRHIMIRSQAVKAPSFETVIKLLDAAVTQLESAAQRKLDLERRRGDLETELAIMQDDRSRLATDLDGTMARLGKVETAAGDAVQRLDRAMIAIHAALGEELVPVDQQPDREA